MKNLNGYPKSHCPVRPYHLWDEQNQKRVRSRYFTSVRNACDRAMSEVKWYGKVGETITVFDTRYGRMIGQYTRRVKTLTIYEPKPIN